MDDLWVRNASLVRPSNVEEGDCLVQDGKITMLGKIPPTSVCRDHRVLDADGQYITPGFIDLHIHGGGGCDFMDADQVSYDTIFSIHVQHGTTALLAAVIPAPKDRLREALRVLGGYHTPWLLGVYLEGPFVSRDKKGAFNPQWILPPNPSAIQALLAEASQMLKVITLAPEIPGTEEVVRHALAIGAVPAIGHTDATYRQTMTALQSGARHFTHLANAMRGLHHREPGAMGAALDSDAFVELICDGVHLHPAVVRLVAKAKGFNRICLVTDAVSAAGMPDGTYHLGDQEVVVRAGEARLADGTLAGSTLTMERAVRNFLQFTHCSIPEAIRCATLTPAQLLGIDNRKGSLEVGRDADLVLLDSEFNVSYTILRGEIVYAHDRKPASDS